MNKEYWESNIKHWSKLYLDISHAEEKFLCPGIMERLYHKTITPIEARLMRTRYEKTIGFIDRHVKAGDLVGDLGCGSGIFTVELLKRGARVVCVDYTQASLDMARKLVDLKCPELSDRVQYFKLDLTKQQIPQCDVAFAMGVTPYVDDIEAFYGNILPQTKLFYCLMVDPANFSNRLRRLFPILNVRGLRFHAKKRLDAIYLAHGWNLNSRENFATGYLDLAEAASASHRG